MDKKSTHLVSGFDEWMGRHEKGKELRTEQDAKDDKVRTLWGHRPMGTPSPSLWVPPIAYVRCLLAVP